MSRSLCSLNLPTRRSAQYSTSILSIVTKRNTIKRSFATTSSIQAPATDSTTRFSSRVTDYISSRPSYPPAIVTLLAECFNLQHGSTIADIGSGTGILSVLLLEQLKDHGTSVIGIEPNKEMRGAAERLLKSYEARFESKQGTAETTGLDDKSVDLVVAAQAFHWFDIPKAREEFRRILRGDRSGVALIWNDRRGVAGTAAVRKEIEEKSNVSKGPTFNAAYDLLLVRRGKDYEKVDHHRLVDEDALKSFFGPKGYQTQTYDNPYRLAFEQVKSRLLSSSYAPQKGDNGYDLMISELREMFDEYQEDGKVDFVYDTRVFYGELSA